MTISPFSAGYYNIDLARTALGTTKAQLDDLQQQLNTGLVSQTYGGLGGKASTALDLNSKISATSGYLDTIASASNRISFLNSALTQLSSNVSDSAAANAYTYTFTGGTTTAQVSAQNYLSEAVDLLNTNIGGQYIFSGRSSDTQPVVDLDTILNGDGTKAGVKELISERTAADLGSGTGRLVISGAGTAVSLSEEAAGLPFGMKLNTAVQNSLTNVAVTGPSSGTIGVTFNGQPNPGEAMTVTLTLPDGSTSDVTLTAAGAGTTATSGQFQIGATAADTAANFQAALTSSIQTTAQTDLSAASALKASQDFYAGSTSNPPQRIAPPYASATGFVSSAQAAATTVIWYQGDDDTSVSARDTSLQRVDATQSVAIGARANETAIQNALAQWTALAATSYSSTSSTDQLRYNALATRLQTDFAGQPGTPSVTDIASEISTANAAVSSAKDRNTTRLSVYQGNLTDLVSADPATVVTQIQSLQTRLQASYYITSTLGSLSLTQYL